MSDGVRRDKEFRRSAGISRGERWFRSLVQNASDIVAILKPRWRPPLRQPGGREDPWLVSGREALLYYIVSGGGGAYMSATHRIPKVDLDGVAEDDFVCYPRRGDSLSFYSKLYDRRFGLGRGWLEIAPNEGQRT